MSPIEDREGLPGAGRLVVKIGSSSLTGPDGGLAVDALERIVRILAARRRSGTEIVLVTSGAVAAGRARLGLSPGRLSVGDAQAAASVGQGALMTRYTEAFAGHGLAAGQLLLSAEDTVRRSRYRNAVRAFDALFGRGAVPVVNENDALVTDELRFGDNDRLAALVAQLVRADALVLLTDVDGLYDGPPGRPGAVRIPVVADADALSGIELGGSGSRVGTGGMVTKLQSARIAAASGIPVLLAAAGRAEAALAGGPVGTWFRAAPRRGTRLQVWLRYAAEGRGRLVLDEGAVRALEHGGASLLPAGILRVEGEFDAGDPVELVAEDGRTIARGVVAFDAGELPGMLGRSTRQLRDSLGERFEREVVHRDDLALVDARGRDADGAGSAVERAPSGP
ncbi:MAG: glutamate 5-kinase [Pseudoclavibacter sp.]|nr:glutamate 5-kinase [Pseudoclavibacter sp.]